MKIIYTETKQQQKHHIINIMVHLFRVFFQMHFVRHLISTWQVAVRNKAWKERIDTTSNSSVVGLRGAILSALQPSSLFALAVDPLLPVCVCAFCTCLHLLRVSSQS